MDDVNTEETFRMEVLPDPFIDSSVDTVSFVPSPPCSDELIFIKVRRKIKINKMCFFVNFTFTAVYGDNLTL